MNTEWMENGENTKFVEVESSEQEEFVNEIAPFRGIHPHLLMTSIYTKILLISFKTIFGGHVQCTYYSSTAYVITVIKTQLHE